MKLNLKVTFKSKTFIIPLFDFSMFKVTEGRARTNKIKDYYVHFTDEHIVPDVLRFLVTYEEGKWLTKSPNASLSIFDNTTLSNIETPDVYIGKKDWDDINLNNSVQKTSEQLSGREVKNIVLILESPHTEEYSDDLSPYCPAVGETGQKIEQHIDDLMHFLKLDTNDDFHLIIANPVPLQASLGHSYKNPPFNMPLVSELRNKIWKSLFEKEEIRNHFIERIEIYNPSVLINACTYDLKKKVKSLMEVNFKSQFEDEVFIYTETQHPSASTFADSLRII